jgi:dolichol-phosphate mannosyltransferase
MTELSIILPVHNEAGVIARTVGDIHRVLNDANISHEFICVENGSTDESPKILQTLSKKYPLKMITSDIGWGNAVRAALRYAQGKVACYMVSDGQVEAKYIAELYKLYKLDKLSNQERYSLFKVWRTNRENTTRLANSRIYNLISRIIFGIGSRDINATPKLMETKLLQSIPLTSENIAVDLELLLQLRKRGLKWLEIPAASMKRDGGKSTTNLKTVQEMIWCMIKFRLGAFV